MSDDLNNQTGTESPQRGSVITVSLCSCADKCLKRPNMPKTELGEASVRFLSHEKNCLCLPTHPCFHSLSEVSYSEWV